MNECQICRTPAPLVPGLCDGVAGYRLIRDPWAGRPSFLDGNLHFSCLAESEKNPVFFAEFTHMLRAGHEEVDSLDGTPPPLTRMGLGMRQIFSGSECRVFESGVSDRWMVVRRTGPWFRLRRADLTDIERGRTPLSPAEVTPYRLPMDLGGVDDMSLLELLSALGVNGTGPQPTWRAPQPLPDEARGFLANHAKTYTPVTFEDEKHA
ncbi:hypothetical protein [Streptomyces olivochromogenes]|uniref:hypothetical protein n=1 Tax=Streptomyces olivochromogenes TaxID=1963 RepID=UPI001F2FB466|nr:hypothetical protein [Streptomyces olivochromogenes]